MHTPPTPRSPPAPPEQALLPWLGLLRQLYPPTGVLLVGAGGGTSPWVQHLMATDHRNVSLIEADEPTAARLKQVAQAQPSWTVQCKVVGRNSEPAPFYTASLQAESSLLEPESLRSLWPNLHTTHRQTCQATTLADLQPQAETPANWLLVDCLPALPIIQGAAQQLAGFDVLALRLLLNSSQDLHLALQAQGFRCLATETSRHPEIGHALFVRDVVALAQQQQRQLAQAKAEVKQADEQAQASRAQAQAALAKAAAEARAAQSAAAAATASAAAAAKQVGERAAQVQQLTQAKAAADKLAAERQQLIEQLQLQCTQLDDAQAMQASASDLAKEALKKALDLAQAEKAELTNEKANANAAREKIEKLASERQARVKLLEQRVQTLQATLNDGDARCRLLQAELLKAEDQIELIKTFVLQGPAP